MNFLQFIQYNNKTFTFYAATTSVDLFKMLRLCYKFHESNNNWIMWSGNMLRQLNQFVAKRILQQDEICLTGFRD